MTSVILERVCVLVAIVLMGMIPRPQVADVTAPPANAQVRLIAEAQGVQIYHCGVQTGSYQWIFDAPAATLFDPKTHQQVGMHSAGPTWTWSDGSAIAGKVLQKQASPDAGAIPWLLLETHASGDTTGALTGVTMVRRSNTQAGAAPATGCDAAHDANVLRVPYEATYTFYSTK